MPTRTIPAAYPNVKTQEVMTGRVIRASTLRRMAQSQNFLWANLRKVYQAHAYEGFGSLMANLPPTNNIQTGVEPLPDGSLGKLMSSFYVPRNWCAGSRVRIAYQARMGRTSGSTTGKIIAVLCRMDETATGVWTSHNISGVGTFTSILRLRVPQDGEYQIKVYLQFTNGDPASETPFSNNLVLDYVSARYDQPDEQDLFGQTFDANKRWKKHYDVYNLTDWPPAASHFYQRIVDNTNWMWHNRGAEICQSYLGLPWNNTTTFAEVGRYVCAHVAGVTQWAGRLHVYIQNGGAGCEVRLLVGGVVIQTWTALAAGAQTLTVNAFSPGTSTAAIDDRVVTIEAKNLGGSYWGSIVWGVFLWESAVDETGLPTIPSVYSPQDESALEGDDLLVSSTTTPSALKSGLRWLQENDRWLYKNRLRMVVGDWRHRTYKRLATYAAAGTTFDARVDWTRADQWANQILAPRNITINGTSSANDDVDSIGDYDKGAGTSVGYNEAPFTYPTSMTHLLHGRRLGLGFMGHVNSPLAASLYASWGLKVRARRCRPAIMSSDQNGFGPLAEETPYLNKAYLELVYNGATVPNPIRIQTTPVRPDHEHQWHLGARGSHTVSTGAPLFTVRGRLPGQPSGVPAATRPEGMLFEVELASVFLADEPLTQDAIDSL